MVSAGIQVGEDAIHGCSRIGDRYIDSFATYFYTIRGSLPASTMEYLCFYGSKDTTCFSHIQTFNKKFLLKFTKNVHFGNLLNLLIALHLFPICLLTQCKQKIDPFLPLDRVAPSAGADTPFKIDSFLCQNFLSVLKKTPTKMLPEQKSILYITSCEIFYNTSGKRKMLLKKRKHPRTESAGCFNFLVGMNF